MIYGETIRMAFEEVSCYMQHLEGVLVVWEGNHKVNSGVLRHDNCVYYIMPTLLSRHKGSGCPWALRA